MPVIVSAASRAEILGLRVSMRNLYTPVLILTALLCVRAWIALRPRVRLGLPSLFRHWRIAVFGSAACAVVLMPVLYAMTLPSTGRVWQGPRVYRTAPAASGGQK